MGFQGFERADGSAGVRNLVAVISTVVCANGVVDAIARAVPEVKKITHTEGCGRGPEDIGIASRTLIGLGKNPNVAAALVVGLGCEFIKADIIAGAIAAGGKPVETLIIQDEGGSRKSTTKGIEIVNAMLAEASRQQRTECAWDKLIVGLECGGSDAMSGVTANPLVGVAVDWLVEQGGTAILSETTELIGTEDILARRAVDEKTALKLTRLIKGQYQMAKEKLGPFADLVISPGNIEGGLSSIQEKSLGCIVKAGSGPIQEVLDYSEPPTRKGLAVMDTPGSDVFSLTAMAAGGAQIIVFTTGRGSPAGFPLAPVIKVASTSEVYEKMKDDMDLDAGRILSGLSIAQGGRELVDMMARVAGGEQTKAEVNGNDLLAIHTLGPAF